MTYKHLTPRCEVYRSSAVGSYDSRMDHDFVYDVNNQCCDDADFKVKEVAGSTRFTPTCKFHLEGWKFLRRSRGSGLAEVIPLMHVIPEAVTPEVLAS